jgi:hypothetical protein
LDGLLPQLQVRGDKVCPFCRCHNEFTLS